VAFLWLTVYTESKNTLLLISWPNIDKLSQFCYCYTQQKSAYAKSHNIVNVSLN